MKVKVSIVLDLPEVKDGNVNLEKEYVAGISWKMAYVIQDVFDNFLNYAICAHLQDALKWMGRHKDLPNSELIVKSHNEWADILRAAEPTMKIEEIK